MTLSAFVDLLNFNVLSFYIIIVFFVALIANWFSPLFKGVFWFPLLQIIPCGTHVPRRLSSLFIHFSSSFLLTEYCDFFGCKWREVGLLGLYMRSSNSPLILEG